MASRCCKAYNISLPLLAKYIVGHCQKYSMTEKSHYSKSYWLLTQVWSDVNPLKGRGVNWLHFAIQV